jgi:hypothetical protein
MAVVLSRSGQQVGRKRVMRLAVCCCCRCKHVGNARDAEVRILAPQPASAVFAPLFPVWCD